MESGDNEILTINDANTGAYFDTVKEDVKDMEDMKEILFDHAVAASDGSESTDYIKSGLPEVQKKKKPRARKKGNKQSAHGQNLSKM